MNAFSVASTRSIDEVSVNIPYNTINLKNPQNSMSLSAYNVVATSVKNFTYL